MQYIISIDQSTSGTKVMLIDKNGKIVSKLTKAHAQYYPDKNWIEHDGNEIWRNVCALISRIIFNNNLQIKNIDSLTISNQRETTILWDRATGEPIYNAVVWQCQRGAEICRELSDYEKVVRNKTGLTLSPYYPAAKAAWMLKNLPNVMKRAKKGEICFGTIDSYLIYRLTGCKRHVIDMSNASRTQLFNIKRLQWDIDLLNLFQVPIEMLPEVIHSDGNFGETDEKTGFGGIHISAVLGDSHAALFGHGCLKKGMIKATYGTGSSVMCNIGEEYMESPRGISLSLAWGFKGKVHYVLEGNITSSGDTLSWLINELQLVKDIKEIETLSNSVENSGGVYLIPAFSGLGAPHFDSEIRASITGMNRSSNKAHVVRAALESLAYQVTDVVDIIKEKCKINYFYASGGATVNPLLMQLQADYLGKDIIVTLEKELSALGVAYMGGLTTGFFKKIPIEEDTIIYKKSNHSNRKKELEGWRQAVQQALNRRNILD